MCSCFFLLLSSKPKLKCENDPQKPLLITKDDGHEAELHNPTAAMALVLTSWLHGRRLRYLILALCLPLLIPIACASIPVLCAVEICFYFCRRKRCRLKSGPPPDVDGGGEAVVVVEMNLLERYLDDQLGLALEYACECDSGSDEADEFYGNRSNNLLLC